MIHNLVLYAKQLDGMDITLLRTPTGTIAGIAVQFGRDLPVPIAPFVIRHLIRMVPQITTGLEKPDILTLETWCRGLSNTAKASGIFRLNLTLPKSGVRVLLQGQAMRRKPIALQ